jgi:hypothetical protein
MHKTIDWPVQTPWLNSMKSLLKIKQLTLTGPLTVHSLTNISINKLIPLSKSTMFDNEFISAQNPIDHRFWSSSEVLSDSISRYEILLWLWPQIYYVCKFLHYMALCNYTARQIKPATNYNSWIEFEKQPIEVHDVEAVIDLSTKTSRESSASR